MKLIFAVVQGSDAEPLLTNLTRAGYRATQINSHGGFLRDRNVTLVIGVQDDQVVEVKDIVRANCHSRARFVNALMPIIEPGEFYIPSPVEVMVGGATLLVLNVERYERLGIA